mmetsp:Transcript_80298/g.236194  ORF Transcript_80298/g.236194 Transcript_80298/m.236194 type:complete len:152 (+) Transcript_80298:318-773(+)
MAAHALPSTAADVELEFEIVDDDTFHKQQQQQKCCTFTHDSLVYGICDDLQAEFCVATLLFERDDEHESGQREQSGKQLADGKALTDYDVSETHAVGNDEAFSSDHGLSDPSASAERSDDVYFCLEYLLVVLALHWDQHPYLCKPAGKTRL